jgi:hypothetical protein
MDVYKIGVSIALTNNISSALAVIGRQFTGLHTSARAIENNFTGWSRALAGVGGLLASGAIIGSMAKLVDKTKEYSAELVKIERLGSTMGSMVRSGAFEKKAFEISRKTGLNAVDAMKIPGDTYSIIGTDPSMQMWEGLAKYQFVQQQSRDVKGNPKDDLNKLIRAGEMTGRLTDPVTSHAGVKQLEAFLDFMAKVGAATHGMVNADTMIGMAKQGGFTLRGMSEEGMMTMAMQAQAMGGNRAGTAILSTWGQIVSGTMLKRTAQGMQDLGLLKEGEWKTGKGGQVLINEDASKRLHGLISKDPMDLATAIREEFKRQGITDPEEQMRRVARAFGRQTTQRFTAEEIMNYKQMEEERGRINQGLGSQESWQLYMDKSVPANIDRMQNAWKDLLYAVAGPQAQGAIGVMKEITGYLNSMTDIVRGMDPGTMSAVAKGMAAFAVALAGVSIAALIAIAGIPGVIVGLVAALGTLVALNWGSLKGGINSVAAALQSLDAWVGNFIKSIWGYIKSLPGMVLKPLLDYGNRDRSKDGDAPTDGLKQPMNFNPRDIRMKAAPITLALNVDGRALGQVVSQQIDYLHEHPTSAPSYDTASRFGPADGGIMSG